MAGRVGRRPLVNVRAADGRGAAARARDAGAARLARRAVRRRAHAALRRLGRRVPGGAAGGRRNLPDRRQPHG